VWQKVPEEYFRRDLRAAVDKRADEPILTAVKPWLDAYGEEELRYYLIRWGQYSCNGSELALRELHRELDAAKPERRRKRPKR
jgi:hypothetical protein